MPDLFRSALFCGALIFPAVGGSCSKEKGRTEQIPATPDYELIGADASEIDPQTINTSLRVSKPDWEWEQELTELQFRVTRKGETEPRFTGELHKETRKGTYHCLGCNALLFDSESKYESDFGWPTFSSPADPGRITTKRDDTAFRKRTAVQCRNCDAHLGHLFDDGPKPEGTRYNMNASALKFVPGS